MKALFQFQEVSFHLPRGSVRTLWKAIRKNEDDKLCNLWNDTIMLFGSHESTKADGSESVILSPSLTAEVS